MLIYLHFLFVSRRVYNRFGVVTSFTGTYKADEWSLVLSSPRGTTAFFIHCSMLFIRNERIIVIQVKYFQKSMYTECSDSPPQGKTFVSMIIENHKTPVNLQFFSRYGKAPPNRHRGKSVIK